MDKRSLQQRWQELCNEYLKQFCKRHEYEYDEDAWIGIDKDNVGAIADIADMFISMDDIRYDVDHEVPIDSFEEWYWKRLDLHELGVERWMNYPNYCQGAPDEWTDERMNELRELHKQASDTKERLEELCKDYKEIKKIF